MPLYFYQVNEIAKFNKLQPKYVLAGEEGPPHHKTFTVYLELGAEKYEGTGTSIKKEIALKALCTPLSLGSTKNSFLEAIKRHSMLLLRK